jgi:RNA polymerase sigma-70 factor, ECF subfamily
VSAAHHELTDTALLEAHRDGDPDAFGVLFTRHRDRLWAVALRTTGNPEDAADALQEAMISAFRRADSFRGDALVTTWLHRIVVNASVDRLRRNKVRAAQPLPDDLEEYADRGAVLASGDDASDPEAQAVLTDRRGTVLAALERLPPDQKAAVVLVDLEGYPVDQVAQMLDCPTGTVKSRCARGRARLAVMLRESGITGTAVPPDASDPGPHTTPQGHQGGART